MLHDSLFFYVRGIGCPVEVYGLIHLQHHDIVAMPSQKEVATKIFPVALCSRH